MQTVTQQKNMVHQKDYALKHPPPDGIANDSVTDRTLRYTRTVNTVYKTKLILWLISSFFLIALLLPRLGKANNRHETKGIVEVESMNACTCKGRIHKYHVHEDEVEFAIVGKNSTIVKESETTHSMDSVSTDTNTSQSWFNAFQKVTSGWKEEVISNILTCLVCLLYGWVGSKFIIKLFIERRTKSNFKSAIGKRSKR
jgi:hypothetical protein